jgi:WD40 repeat protein
VNDISFSPDGEMLATATWWKGNSVQLWDPSDGTLLQVLSGHTSWVSAVVFSPSWNTWNKMLASGSWDDTVLLWDASAERNQVALEFRCDNQEEIATSPDGTKIATQIGDIPTGNLFRELKLDRGEPSMVTFLPTGERLVSVSSYRNPSRQELWDLLTGHCLQTISNSYVIHGVLLLGDRLMSIDNETKKIWDHSTGQCLASLKACTGLIREATFSPEGDRIVLNIEKRIQAPKVETTIQVWDISRGQCSHTFRLEAAFGGQIAFSPDRQKLAVSDDKIIHLWCLSTGEHLQTFDGHANVVTVIEFTNDGKLLASASGFAFMPFSASVSPDNSLRLWNPLTGECLYKFEDIPAISRLSFSGDDQCLKTSLGTLQLDRSSGTLKVRPHGFVIKRQWITYNGRNILWLPAEYRPRFTAVCDNVVVIVPSSGQLIFLDFALE